jgi:predicted AlkP superfamily phosphohydrolase/phosphomutase
MSNRRKTLIIGLDGATFTVLKPWMEDGTLPNLKRVAEAGVSAPLGSTVPPVTAPAWISFMTGKDPAHHGVFDFVRPTSEGRAVSIVSHADIRHETLYTLLKRHGRRVSTVNMPITYPLPPVDGAAISGMLTPGSAEDTMFPPNLPEELAAAGIDYVRDVGWERAEGQEVELVDRMIHCTRERIKAAKHLMQRYPWDCFMVVFTCTDRVQHSLWHYLFEWPEVANDPEKTRAVRSRLIAFYQLLDSFIGDSFDSLDDETTLLILSDHGFGPLRGKLQVNTFLEREGWLALDRAALSAFRQGVRRRERVKRLIGRVDVFDLWGRLLPRLIRRPKRMRNYFFLQCIDWSRTRAFSVSNTEQGIYINLKGRQRQGIVEPGEEYERLRDEIIGALGRLQCPDDSAPLVSRVYKKEEIYGGPYAHAAPDIVFVLKEGEFVADVQPVEHLFEPRTWHTGSGTHRMEGILFAAGNNIRAHATLDGATIPDVAPTVLYNMGLPIPDDMTGRVLAPIFTEEFRQAAAPTFEKGKGSRTAAGSGDPRSFSADEQADLEARLRDLGYL